MSIVGDTPLYRFGDTARFGPAPPPGSLASATRLYRSGDAAYFLVALRAAWTSDARVGARAAPGAGRMSEFHRRGDESEVSTVQKWLRPRGSIARHSGSIDGRAPRVAPDRGSDTLQAATERRRVHELRGGCGVRHRRARSCTSGLAHIERQKHSTNEEDHSWPEPPYTRGSVATMRSPRSATTSCRASCRTRSWAASG